MNKIFLTAVTIAVSLLAVSPAFADSSSTSDLKADLKAVVAAHIGSTTAASSSDKKQVRVSATATVQTKLTNAITLADKEITRRNTALSDLSTKVQGLVKVSASEKASLSTEVQNEIAALNTLKVKIDADTSTTTVKADVQSITKDYRIFLLVIPQGRIEVAADKIQTIAGLYTTLSAKLQTRIAAGQTAGKDVTVVNGWLADMNAKVADATAHAQAAVSLVATLQPDQGVQASAQSNQTALKTARADIKTALQDLKTARQDAGSIVKTVESWRLNTAATTSVSTQ